MEVSLRALNSRQSVLQRADGSAQWQQGHTELLAAVYGPREAARKHELMDRADLQIIVHPASGVHTPEHTRQEQWLKGIFSSILLLSLHPRTNITVAVQIVYDDGCLASALVNCVTLALIDAGIAMKSLAVSAEVIISPSGELLLDPSNEQLNTIAPPNTSSSSSSSNTIRNPVSSRLVFVHDADGNLVAENSVVEGGDKIDEKKYWAAKQLAKESASKLLQFVKLTTSAKVLYECRGSAF